MIEGFSSFDLQSIARSGGSLEVDGSAYIAFDLQAIARCLVPGAVLKIYNSQTFAVFDLQSIARCKLGQVIFAGVRER